MIAWGTKIWMYPQNSHRASILTAKLSTQFLQIVDGMTLMTSQLDHRIIKALEIEDYPELLESLAIAHQNNLGPLHSLAFGLIHMESNEDDMDDANQVFINLFDFLLIYLIQQRKNEPLY